VCNKRTGALTTCSEVNVSGKFCVLKRSVQTLSLLFLELGTDFKQRKTLLLSVPAFVRIGAQARDTE
jgi:hypothetical protein